MENKGLLYEKKIKDILTGRNLLPPALAAKLAQSENDAGFVHNGKEFFLELKNISAPDYGARQIDYDSATGNWKWNKPDEMTAIFDSIGILQKVKPFTPRKFVKPDNELTEADKIIANPNCSTIQMVLALAPLHKKYNIKRIVVSTYQSVTGSGLKAVQQLENEYNGIKGEMAYKYPIHRNAIPQIDVFEENGYTKEEMKMVRETQKILGDKTIAVTSTTVRIPVVGGHSESVNVEFSNDFDVNDIRKILHETDGVTVQDNIDTFTYPMPMYAEGKDDVFVGRIRRDESQPNTVNMWIVSDNLRKGAATNTIQIAEYLIANKLV